MIENNGAGGGSRTRTEGLPPQDFKSRIAAITRDQKHAEIAISPLSGAVSLVGSRWYKLGALGSLRGQSWGQGHQRTSPNAYAFESDHAAEMARWPYDRSPDQRWSKFPYVEADRQTKSFIEAPARPQRLGGLIDAFRQRPGYPQSLVWR